MNVLVISSIEWSDENAYGNTLSNWFSDQESMRFACLYRRNTPPNNRVCHEYYRITFPSILKNLLTPGRIGYHFYTEDGASEAAGTQAPECRADTFEKRMIACIKKYNLQLVYWLQTVSFRTKLWNNGRFKDFIAEFKPDIVFTSIKDCVESEWIIREILRQRPQCRFVGFLADDVYGGAPEKGKRNIRAQIQMASRLYGITHELCDAYGELFCRPFEVLYKGCEFDTIHSEINQPMRLVYAGNLFYGRDKILGQIGRCLARINENGMKAVLEIYTGAVIDGDMSRLLNIPGASRVMGVRPYSEICRIMNQADLVLEVESFEQTQIDYVHYSFSTKITDCLQCGSVPLAIGPAGIASIEYVRRIPGAFVIDELSQLEEKIDGIIQHADELSARAESVRGFARENHDIEKIRKQICEDFEELLQ